MEHKAACNVSEQQIRSQYASLSKNIRSISRKSYRVCRSTYGIMYIPQIKSWLSIDISLWSKMSLQSFSLNNQSTSIFRIFHPWRNDISVRGRDLSSKKIFWFKKSQNVCLKLSGEEKRKISLVFQSSSAVSWTPQEHHYVFIMDHDLETFKAMPEQDQRTRGVSARVISLARIKNTAFAKHLEAWGFIRISQDSRPRRRELRISEAVAKRAAWFSIVIVGRNAKIAVDTAGNCSRE